MRGTRIDIEHKQFDFDRDSSTDRKPIKLLAEVE